MLSTKRKRQEDSDDDEPSYGKQILPVADLPDDFNDEPSDGMQYLFMVRRDAKQLPGTVRVANPYEKPEEPTTDPQSTAFLKDSVLPSKAWVEVLEYRFRNLRQNINQPTIHVNTGMVKSQRLIPEKKDREQWWAFLSGRPESEWNPTQTSKSKQIKSRGTQRGMLAWSNIPSLKGPTPEPPIPYHSADETNEEESFDGDPSATLPSPVGTPVPLEHLETIAQPSPTLVAMNRAFPDEHFSPRAPTTEFLKLINERFALHLLMYFTHWINLYVKSPETETYLPTECHAKWIFSLLTRIDDYISADDMHLLRNLARSCMELLKIEKRPPSSSAHQINWARQMNRPSCWIIIAIIAEMWKQRDLWVDAEGMLRRSG